MRRLGRANRFATRIRIGGSILFLLLLVAGVASAAALDTYRDDFLAATFDGSDGTLLWTTDWIEVGESDGPNTGLIEVKNEPHCADTICMPLGRNGAISDASVEREADLSAAAYARLTFEYKRHLHITGGGGRVDLEVSDNGGTDWYPLDSWNLDATDPGQVAASYDLTPYRSIDTRIRFSVVGSADASHLNVDNVQITVVDSTSTLYLVADTGGAGAGEDLLTATDPSDLDPVTNEASIGLGTGTTAIKAAAMQPGTGLLFAADGGQLGTISLSTGLFTPAANPFGTGNGSQGPQPFNEVAGLAFDPYSGVLYGVQQRSPFVEDLLFIIDPSTGSHVPSAFSGDDYIPIQEQSLLYHISDLAIDPTDGQMYGIHWTFAGPIHHLVTIDPASGIATSMGVSPDSTKGLTFDDSGQLWGSTAGIGTDTLFKLDKTDGSASESRTIDNGDDYHALASYMAPVINQVPVFDQDLVDREDTEGTVISLSASATDPNVGDNLYYSATGLPAGLVIDSGSGLISGTIDIGAAGTYATQITVVDDGVPVLNDVDTFTWTVSHPPSLDPIGPQTVDEEDLLSFTATATDADLPGDTLTFTLEGTPPPGASITAGGAFTWTPTEAQGPAVYLVTVRVTDAIGAFDEETVTVNVAEANGPPTLAAIGPRAVSELALLTFTATATDADLPANNLVFSLEGTPPSGATMTGGGLFAWTPTEAQGPGVYNLTIRVTDDGTPALWDEETITITVAEANLPPVVTNPGNQSHGESDPVSLFIVATDTDLPANVLNWTAIGLPTGLTIDLLSGEVSGTISPTAATGSPYAVTVTVTDELGLWDDTVFTWTIVDTNRSPMLDPIGPQSVAEGNTLSFLATATDPDLPADSLTYTLVGTPPAGAAITPGGSFTWTPSEVDGPGVYAITVRVTDDGTPALWDEETITVTVAELDTAPILSPIGARTVSEGVLLTFTTTATDPDVPSNALTFSTVGTPPSGAALTAGGLFTWTPTETQGPAVYSITVRVTDNTGQWDEETFTITVTEGNVAPTLDPIGAKTVAEGATLAFSVAASDTDTPTNTLTFTLEGSPPSGASMTAGGAFTWTPTEGQGPGDYSVTVRVTDNGLPARWDETTITITVTESNVAPTLGPLSSQTIEALSLLTFTAVGIDPDVPANALTFSLEGTPPSGASMTPSGVFSWTPTDGQSAAIYAITIRVTDSGGLWDEGTVLITVNEANLAPSILNPGDRGAVAGNPFSMTLTASDPNGTTPTLAAEAGIPTWAVLVDNADGTASISGTPTSDDVGTRLVTVRASDGSLSDSTSFTITVEPPPIALLPVPELQAVEHSPLSYQFELSRSETDGVRFALAGIVPEGAALDSTTGIFSWTPTEAQGPGVFELMIEIRDSITGDPLDQHPLRIVVAESAAAPRISSPSGISVDRGGQVQFTLSVTDPDLPASAAVFSLVGPVPDGATIDPATGTLRWDVSVTNDVGTHYVRVRVTDAVDPLLFTETEIAILVRAPVVAQRKQMLIEELTQNPPAVVVDLAPPVRSVRRTLTLMSASGLASVRTVGSPVAYLLLLVALVVTFGRISIFPMFGRSRRMEGVVIWREPSSGYGFILGDDDDRQLFFHERMLKRGEEPPVVGDRVSFRLIKGNDRAFAFGVARTESG